MNIIQTKICSKCKNEKELKDFRPQEKGKFGVNGYCIPCHDENSRLNYEKQKNKRIAQVTEWNKKHPENLKVNQKKWRDSN